MIKSNSPGDELQVASYNISFRAKIQRYNLPTKGIPSGHENKILETEFGKISSLPTFLSNCASNDVCTILYGPPCIEALTCRRPPRARTEIALQADVLCGLSTCRCSADRLLARLLFPRSCILLLCEGTSPMRARFSRKDEISECPSPSFSFF